LLKNDGRKNQEKGTSMNRFLRIRLHVFFSTKEAINRLITLSLDNNIFELKEKLSFPDNEPLKFY